MRVHLSWQRVLGANTLQFSVTISQQRASQPTFSVIHVPPQGWTGGFSVKITASNLVDLESAWCEKMGGSPRGGPAFSGLENSNFRGFLRSITEGFKGFTAKGGSLKRLWDSSGPQSSRAARWEKENGFNVVHGAAFKILPVDPNLVLRLAGAH